MNRFATPWIAAAIACCAVAAHASMRVDAADLQPITNGGTGYIGLTASAAMPRMDTMREGMHGWTASAPDRSQDRRESASALQTMGSGPTPGHVRMHRAWGTPD